MLAMSSSIVAETAEGVVTIDMYKHAVFWNRYPPRASSLGVDKLMIERGRFGVTMGCDPSMAITGTCVPLQPKQPCSEK